MTNGFFFFFKCAYCYDLVVCTADSTKNKLQNRKDGPGSVLHFQIIRDIISVIYFEACEIAFFFFFFFFSFKLIEKTIVYPLEFQTVDDTHFISFLYKLMN